MGLWDQGNNNQSQSQQAAQEILTLLKSIEEDVIRLKEQQRADQERFEMARRDVTEIRSLLMKNSQQYINTQELMTRVQFLENELTSLWANFVKDYVTTEEFEDYREKLDREKEKTRLTLAIANTKKMNSLTKRLGWIIGGCFAGFLAIYSVLPQIKEILLWVLDSFR